MRSPIFYILIPALLLASAAAQASPPSQIELNGFLLGQYAKALDATFGKPTQVTTSEDHWTYRVYVFDQTHNAYMAFKSPPNDEKKLSSIQIAGDAGTAMRPFLGLSLGDDKAKVVQILGTPSKIEAETDYPVDLYTYRDRNYSVEISHQGKLSSLQISGYAGMHDRPTTAFPDLNPLKNALMARDVDALLVQLAGDLEIYRSDNLYDFARSARTELSDHNAEIWKLLMGDKGSVRAAFTSEPFDPDQEIRLYEKGPPASVAKFPHSKVIEEIVYNFEAGAWRVWEIKLR